MGNKILSVVGFIVLMLSTFSACRNRNSTNVSVKDVSNQAYFNNLDSANETVYKTVALENSSGENILIAYFSLVDIVPEGADAVSSATPSVGNTETAAREIQKQIGGDLFAIRTENKYPVSHRDASAIAKKELKSDIRPKLTTHVKNMEQYDTVFIGYPLWWYVEPMVIRSFLEEYDFTGKTVIPFCTSLSVVIRESEKNVAKLIPEATMKKGLELHTGMKDFSKEIASWLTSIQIKKQGETSI